MHVLFVECIDLLARHIQVIYIYHMSVDKLYIYIYIYIYMRSTLYIILYKTKVRNMSLLVLFR